MSDLKELKQGYSARTAGFLEHSLKSSYGIGCSGQLAHLWSQVMWHFIAALLWRD